MSRYQYGALWTWCTSFQPNTPEDRKTPGIFVSAAGRQKKFGPVKKILCVKVSDPSHQDATVRPSTGDHMKALIEEDEDDGLMSVH